MNRLRTPFVTALSITAAVCSLVILTLPTHVSAGNDQADQSSLRDLGEVCDASSQCKAELRCEFGSQGARVFESGELGSTNGRGVCRAAYQNDGDDCYLYDCNRRIGMYCNTGSPPTIGSSIGECKRKQAIGGPCGSTNNCQSGLVCDTGAKACVAGSSPVATQTSWIGVCGSKYFRVGEFDRCIEAEGETCITDSECGFSELICNTGYTNTFGAATTAGRTGQCRLPSSIGGTCEEAADCVNGLSCDTASNTCTGASSATTGTGAAGTGTAGSAGTTTAATGNDTSGRPLFGLQWFRNSDTGVRTDSPSAFLTGVTRTVTGVLALILVILILVGGVFMMTAAGDENRYRFGKTIITNAIVGIIIVSAAFIIATFVISAITAV